MARSALGLTLIVIAAAAAAPATTAREYSLGDHGVLVLQVPDAWTGRLQRGSDREPPTVNLGPKVGARFEVQVTALWPAGRATLPDAAALRSEVAAAAMAAESSSTERPLALEALDSSGTHGFYFRATDRAPAPGEFRYLTQGMARIGQIVLAFTILTNDGQDDIPGAALEMIRAAVHRGRPSN